MNCFFLDKVVQLPNLMLQYLLANLSLLHFIQHQ